MKRKLLSIFMVVALILTLAPFVVVSAAPPAEDDDDDDVEAVTAVEDGEDADDEDDEDDEDDADDEDDEDDEVVEVDSATPADPLDGANISLVEELAIALELGFVPESMIGNWTEPTSRLLAAEMIVMLVEVVMEMSIDEVAEEFDLDMDDAFSDTDDVAATFLKAAGISNGVDGVRYDPDGKFTRVMMVTMLGRLAENLFGINFSGYKLGTDVFIDLPASGYGYADRYVGWAAETGITLGQGAADRFAPGADLTNQATVAFTFRAYDVILEAVEQLEADGAADTDAILEGADDALKEELARALELGIIPDEVSGKWTQQTSNIILAEALVAMIEAVSGKTIADIAEENEFDVDLDAFSDTDSEAASFLHAANVMIGSSDGMFYPEELIGEHWILYLLLQFTAENIFGIDIAAEPVPAETFAGLPEWAQELAGLAGGWAVNAGILRISAAGDTEFAGVVQNQHLALYLLRMYEYLRG